MLVKLDKYQFGAEIVTDEQLREGKRQLERHKKNTERAYRRGDLRNFLQKVTMPPPEEAGNSGGFFSNLFATITGNRTRNARDLVNMAGDEPGIKEPAGAYVYSLFIAHPHI